MELTNQAVVNYIGDYDYYLEKKEELTSTYAPGSLLIPEAPAEEKAVSENKLSWQQMKEEQAKKRKTGSRAEKKSKPVSKSWKQETARDRRNHGPSGCLHQCMECTKLSHEKKQPSLKNWKSFMKNGKSWPGRSALFIPLCFYGSSMPRCCSKHTPSLRSVPSSTASRIDAEIKSTASSAQGVFMEYLLPVLH